MFDPDARSTALVGAVVTAWLTMLLVITLGVPYTMERYCKPGEEYAQCWREWLMVAGTWGAVVSGIFAAIIVFFTIRPLFGQLAEMRRQTRFIVGDEEPTIAVWTNTWSECFRFRIVNWNRNAFKITEVHWETDCKINVRPELWAVRHLAPDPEYYTPVHDRQGYREVRMIQDDGVLSGWISLEGWENRSAAPDTKVFWQPKVTGVDEVTFDRSAKVTVVGHLVGAEHTEVRIQASIPDLVDSEHARRVIEVGRPAESSSRGDKFDT